MPQIIKDINPLKALLDYGSPFVLKLAETGKASNSFNKFDIFVNKQDINLSN